MDTQYNLTDSIYEILYGPTGNLQGLAAASRLATEVSMWLSEAYHEGLMAGREEGLGLDA